ncbi:MAG: diguanylate cyclase [Nitrospira sp.]|nr:diguanylate cyclase [Nitrospira sp.]
MAKKRIMVVEDESITAMNIERCLEDIGYTVTSIEISGEDAVKKAHEDGPDMVLMDIVLKGDIDGIETAKRIRSQFNIPIVYLTAHSDESMMKRINKTEPLGYIIKPFDEKELRVALDIAFYKFKMESKLKRSEEKYREVVEGTGDLVTSLDRERNIVYVNHVAEDIFGLKPDNCLGMSIFQFIHPADKLLTINWFNNSVEKRLAQGSLENRQVNHKTGSIHYMLWTSNFYFDEKGGLLRVNSIARDISGRKKYEEYLKRAVITDDLTGLLNRRGFFTLAEQQRKLVNRSKRGMSLLYLDLDGFKNINDELGHREGDMALVDTANILKKTFRESDIVARIGGDEFAVLLTEPTGTDVENIIAEHFRNNLREFNAQAGRKYELIVSIGIARYDQERRSSIEELLMRADHLMYKDKNNRLLQDISGALGPDEERREYKRYSPVKNCIAEIDGSFSGEIKDISYGGTCLTSVQHININDTHEIQVNGLSITGLVMWASLKGERIRKDKKLSFYETGFRFINMKQNKMSLLKRFITEITDEG